MAASQPLTSTGYVLAIDIGSTNVKTVLTDIHGNQVLCAVSRPLGVTRAPPKDVPPELASEIGVEGVFSALEICMDEMNAQLAAGVEVEGRLTASIQFEDIKGIGVCGQMHGCALWNGEKMSMFDPSEGKLRISGGEMTTDFITWQDKRCDAEFLSSLPQPRPSAGYGCATLAWLQRHRKDAISQANRAANITDIVVSALCSAGKDLVVMSSQHAASWGYFDLSTSSWLQHVVEPLFPNDLLPAVKVAPALAGHLMADWHGIPQGTPVGVAMGDLQCSILAAHPQVTETGRDIVLNIGTASQLAVVIPGPHSLSSSSSSQPSSTQPSSSVLTSLPSALPDSVTELPFFFGDHLLVALSLAGGNVFSLFVDTLLGWINELEEDEEVEEKGEEEVEEKEEEEVKPKKETKKGNDKVKYDAAAMRNKMFRKLMQAALKKLDTPLHISPILWGERHTPEQRGEVTNLQPGSLSLGDVGSAMIRGVVQNLIDMMPIWILKHLKVCRVVCNGQTFQTSPVLQEHVRRVFNAEGLKIDLLLRSHSGSPLGAAIAIAKLINNQISN